MLTARRKLVFIILIGVIVLGGGIFAQYKYKLFTRADVLSGPDFTDVPLDSPNYWFIHAMKVNGVTMGCTATTFCPTQATTREQMMMFLQRAAKLETAPFKADDQATWAVKFPDLDPSRLSWPSVQAVVDAFGASKNLLQNSGFETWDTPTAPNPWAPGRVALNQESTQIHEGKYSVHLSTTYAGRSGAVQVLKALPAGTYQISAWVKVISGQAGININYSAADTVNVGPSDWRRVAYTFNNPLTQDVTLWLGSVGAYEAYFDEVKFYRTDDLSTTCFQGSFCPTNNLARQTMAQWLSWILGLDTSSFNWQDQSTWAANYTDVYTNPLNPAFREIQAISENGITQGCSENPLKYCPDDPVTREQMAIFMVRAFDLPMMLPGKISGQLLLANGQPLGNALVSVEDAYLAVSDANGNFQIKDIPPGTYEVSILLNGEDYIASSGNIIQVNEGDQTVNLSGLVNEAGVNW